MPACPFCRIDRDRVIFENDLALVIKDSYPVSPGHALIIPRDHVSSFFDLSPADQQSLLRALRQARTILDSEYAPDGWNIGINNGTAAGQTIMHLHIHLIPRYKGDSPDPRGGVRWIFPDKARYWKD